MRAETGLAVSVGIAPVKMVAKIASDAAKPDGLLELRSDELRSFLDPLPVGRIWGLGPVGQARVARLGVHTIGQLARLPEAQLRAALGSFGLSLARLARGEDAREVAPWREAGSMSEENTFAEDVRRGDTLRGAIRSHAEAVARRLRREGLRARGVTLKLKLARRLGRGRFPLLMRSCTLPVATDDGGVISEAARRLLTRASVDEPIRLLGVGVARLEAGDPEQLALIPSAAEDPARRQLNRAVDTIQERFGRDALRRGTGPGERAGLSFQIKRGED